MADINDKRLFSEVESDLLWFKPLAKRRRISLATTPVKRTKSSPIITFEPSPPKKLAVRRRKSLKTGTVSRQETPPTKIIKRRVSDGEIFDKTSNRYKPTLGRKQKASVSKKYFSNIPKKDMPDDFTYVDENIYRIGKSRRPTVSSELYGNCDCTTSCSYNCINRQLNTECSEDCQCGVKCYNQKFSKKQYANMECFYTEDRGMGVRASANLREGDFIIEYCGEVIDSTEFERRQIKVYSKHDFYGMCITNDAIIDATRKGNLARFINHCCEPNCRTAIWTINGEKRVGIFAAEDIPKDTELTYDYKFEMYGKQRRQRCKCGAENCKGFIGKKK